MIDCHLHTQTCCLLESWHIQHHQTSDLFLIDLASVLHDYLEQLAQHWQTWTIVNREPQCSTLHAYLTYATNVSVLCILTSSLLSSRRFRIWAYIPWRQSTKEEKEKTWSLLQEEQQIELALHLYKHNCVSVSKAWTNEAACYQSDNRNRLLHNYKYRNVQPQFTSCS